MRFFRKRPSKLSCNNEGARSRPQDLEKNGNGCKEVKTVVEISSSDIDTTTPPQTEVRNETIVSGGVHDRDRRAPYPSYSSEQTQKGIFIEAQRTRERNAGDNGAFVPNQRVSYYFKASETWYDATISDVHYDDGPDRPYYTIQFWRNEIEYDDEDGYESVVCRFVEKQTTPDRLEGVDFDPEKTWTILQNSCINGAKS